jgi:Mlc titration factor MtfA (ptsG expression regulator)
MQREFDALQRAADQGRRTLLDQYGASNPAEFFAVATECFFERGGALRTQHRSLYDVLQRFYGQDPAAAGPDLTAAQR